MSVDQLKPPEWQHRLRELTLEFDPEELANKMHNVEKLLCERLVQLDIGGDGHVERAAISDALGTVRGIQRDKLGYPPWK